MVRTTDNALLANLLPPKDRGRPDLIATSARKHHVTFEDGSKKLCATSGLWNVPLGYGNPTIAEAIYKAAVDASYLSTFRAENSYARKAADALVTFCSTKNSYRRVYFSTSGGSANDLAMKIVRIFHLVHGKHQKNIIASLQDSYHGLSYGAFALTGQNLGQTTYGVDQRSIRHVRMNDLSHLRQLFSIEGNQIGGIFIEPILGNGCRIVDKSFLQELFTLRAQYGFLIIADEVATGFWRTGTAFASERWDEEPDVLLLSKALTNGTMAGSAVLLHANVSKVLDDVVIAHGETQAGTPMVCAAISATLKEFSSFDIESHIAKLSKQFSSALERIQSENDLVTSIEGTGLMRSISCKTSEGRQLNVEEVHHLVRLIRSEGVLVYPGISGIQLFPSYTYMETDFEFLTEKILAALDIFSNSLSGTSTKRI